MLRLINIRNDFDSMLAVTSIEFCVNGEIVSEEIESRVVRRLDLNLASLLLKKIVDFYVLVGSSTMLTFNMYKISFLAVD